MHLGYNIMKIEIKIKFDKKKAVLISFMPQSVLWPVHSLSQSKFRTEYNLVLPLSTSSILLFL
jgi:hypothetical protein